MIPDADNSVAELDWSQWAVILHQYAAATDLVVSFYDVGMRRRIGPILGSGFSRLLAGSPFWGGQGEGTLAERDLASRCAASERLERDSFCAELELMALPVRLFGVVRGVIVFGWVFSRFPSALANAQVAHAAGLAASKLWEKTRMESPVSQRRLQVARDLLATLIAATVYQSETIEELKELSRMREVFLAQVSHDMRTPLAALSLRVEALLMGPLDDPPHVRRVLEDMLVSVHEQERLIGDLIEVAQTRTGQLNVDCVSTMLTPILIAAAGEVQPQADRKRVRLALEGIDPAFATPICADEKRLKQVFWNLLSNAIKFSSEGTEVCMRLGIDDDRYQVCVSDRGAGIDAGLLPRVFDTFVRGGAHNAGGLGLGLSIAKRIVEQHGGRIDAFSHGVGKGATFTVALPRGDRAVRRLDGLAVSGSGRSTIGGATSSDRPVGL